MSEERKELEVQTKDAEKEEFVLSETWAADNIQELDDWIESQGIYLRQ